MGFGNVAESALYRGQVAGRKNAIPKKKREHNFTTGIYGVDCSFKGVHCKEKSNSQSGRIPVFPHSGVYIRKPSPATQVVWVLRTLRIPYSLDQKTA